MTPSVALTTYYADADGKCGNDLRTALGTIISSGYKTISYDNIGYLLKYADTQDADGTTLIDIYSPCSFTVAGDNVTWSGSCSGASNVGCGLNREHTLPQSWFDKASPMVSDAFHIYATDAASNGHRSDFPYGECSGTSYTGTNCNEAGKLGTSTFSGYTGTVYEPADEYKGDIARGYFYMITRYWTTNFNQADGAKDDVCFRYAGGQCEMTDYMLALMLNWHREDPVSEKELIRNEVIYGNSTYHKGNTTSYAQHNRNPFIDYPDLVEYIWGSKKTINIDLSSLVSAYNGGGAGGGSGSDPEPAYTDFVTECGAATRWTITFYDNVHSTEVASKEVNDGATFTFPDVADRTPATSGDCQTVHYHFVGWVSETDKAAPTDRNIKQGGATSGAVTTDATYYAVWAKEE